MLLIALILAAQAPVLDCTNAQAQAAMNECAAANFKRAEADLNGLWPNALASARAADVHDRRGDNRVGYEKTLREAQRFWLSFRDAHCAYEGHAQAGGGNIEPLIYDLCRETLTRARIEQIKRSMEAIAG